MNKGINSPKHLKVVLSTDFVDPSLKFDYWRFATRPMYEAFPVDAEPPSRMEGTIRSSVLGNLLIGSTSFSKHHGVRSPQWIRRNDFDQYYLQLVLNGSLSGDIGNRNVRLGIGDIYMADLTKPKDMVGENGQVISVFIDRDIIDAACRGKKLHGAVVKSSSAAGRLLGGFLRNCCDVAGDLGVQETYAFQDAFMGLMSSLVSENPLATTVAQRTLEQRIADYIDDNICCPELGVEEIMRKFNVSRSHLYRCFIGQGGVSKLIREKRLLAAYRELLRYRGDRRSLIKELAYKYGFSSSGQFLNAFRREFLITPGELQDRARQMGGTNASMMSVQRYFASVQNTVLLGGETLEGFEGISAFNKFLAPKADR